MSSRTKAALGLGLGAVAVTVLAVVPAGATSATTNDGFDRSLASGWGQTPQQQAWVGPTGPFASRVAGSAAQVDLPGRRETRARVSGLVLAQPTVVGDFVVPSATTMSAGLESRLQADGRGYRSRAWVRSDGSVQLELIRRAADGTLTRLCATPTTVRAAAGSTLRLESRTTGTSPVRVQVRASVAGATVPAWQLSCSDTQAARIGDQGGTGVALYSGARATVKLADFQASDVDTAQADPTRVVPTATPTTATPTAQPTNTQPTTTATTQPTATATTTATAAPTADQTMTQQGVAGAAPSYPVPAGAVHVATNGSDSAAGTADAPLRTIAAALVKAPSGGTVVVHGGTYREAGLKIAQGKRLTVQNAPGETVWLDGSTTVTGFTASGSTWVKSGWTTSFDASPTFVRGAPDSTAKYWQMLNPQYPMAAHPDQVWVNGVRQRQVGSAAEVTSGTFYVDNAGDRLVLGSNPTGATVTASVLGHALTILGDGSTVRGLGLRNFANSVPDMGAITLYASGVTLENLVVESPATTGIGVFRSGATLRNVSVDDAGLLGVQANQADGITLDHVQVTNANLEHFNQTPAAGGVKLTSSRGITMRNSTIRGTDGNGFWADESSYDIAVVGSDVTGNAGRGIFLELSEKASVVNNRLADNQGDQIRIADTGLVNVWNNTITGSSVPIQLGQDARNATTDAYAVDERRPQPDPEMTWQIRNTTLGNNVLESNGNISALLKVEDWSNRYTGSQMVSTAESDVYNRTGSGVTWTIAWANGASQIKVYTKLSDFVAAVGKETRGQAFDGSSVLAADGTVRADSGVDNAAASQIPSDVASRTGVGSTPGRIGTWR